MIQAKNTNGKKNQARDSLSRMRDKTRKRRTKAEMDALRAAIYNIYEQHKPLTLRNLFYRLVVGKIIKKSQNEYNNVVIRLCGQMREGDELPWNWIVDNTRWMRKPKTYSSLEDMLEQNQRFYRRALWDDQSTYVEIWCESDSAAGVLYEVTREWDVPLMPARGQSSKTFLRNAAMAYRDIDKPIYVYSFCDHDPSGLQISNNIQTKLKKYSKRDDLVFERVAVNSEQIDAWDLPWQPADKDNMPDKRKVELEAIEPEMLRQLCRDCITQHIDDDVLARTATVEDAERSTLSQIIENMN